MGVVARLDQYASTLAYEFDETTTNRSSITELGTYYASEFNENIVEVTGGLILSLDAGNPSSYPGSGTTWFDLSGNNNNATLVNGATYSSANGGVFNFNGTNQYASSPINVATSNHTIIVIARLTGSGNNRRVIASSSINYILGWSGGGTDKYYPNGWVYDGGGAALTTWICYAGTGDYSADSWQLYKNGVALGTPNNAGANGPNGLVIGGDTLYGEYSNCQVAVVLVYNRVLSAAEIQQNYNILTVSGRFDSLSSGGGTIPGTRTTPLMFANVFPPYDLLSDEFGGTLFGAGQGRYMRQNANKSVIVYNEIDEVTDLRDIVRTGLILDLDAGMNASFNNTGTTWNDLSGRGNNGTLVNGPTYSSANGGSIVFDGVDDTFGGPISCNKTYYSVDFWCYPTQLLDYNWGIILGIGWGDFQVHSTASGGVYVGTSGFSRISPWRNNVYVLNTWQNFTWTFDNGVGTFYKNGVLEASGSMSLSSSSSFTSYGAVNNGTIAGRISNLKVYSGKVLSAAEVTQNFNALKHRFPLSIVTNGLVLNFDAGNATSYNAGISTTTWNDLSGSGNNGTLVNGPTYSSANGGTIVFDGTNDYITSSFATTSGQAVTYCGWLCSTETTATYRNFVDSGTANPMIWWNTSGQIEFDTVTNFTTTAVYRNQWVYVALSKPSGSSSASYYVNGTLVGTGGAYTTPAVTPTWFNRAAAQTWNGNSSNVQVYNRALSATEIQQNYNALRGRYEFVEPTTTDGSTSDKAAPSASYLISLGNTTDGVYWINLPTAGPTQIYCILNPIYDGGGWMMAMKATTGTTFNYSANYWTTANTLNPTENNRNNGDAKFNSMNYFQSNDMMAIWPDISNGGSIPSSTLGWTWLQNNFNDGTRITPISFFGITYPTMNPGGSGKFIKDAKTFSGWASGVFSSQPDIRFYGFNYINNPSYGTSAKCRWGFGWNENAEGLYPSNNVSYIGSNDVSGGIGMDSSFGSYSAGDRINCCQDTTGINRSARVEIYVR